MEDEDKRTVPLPVDPAEAGRRRTTTTTIIAAVAVGAVAVAVVSVVAVTGGSSSSHRPSAGVAAAAGGSSPYAADTGGGYSQQPSFTWSARPGQPPAPASSPSSPASAPVADPPPSGVTGNPAQPASDPAPPTKSVAKPPASPPAGAVPPPASTSRAPSQYQISGTISCLSGNAVAGVWVQADQGSGYSPWQGIGNGSTSRYWYTLPSTIPFSLHIGCGGTPDSWGVALTTPQTLGPVANFTCHDVSGQAEYGTCELQ